MTATEYWDKLVKYVNTNYIYPEELEDYILNLVKEYEREYERLSNSTNNKRT